MVMEYKGYVNIREKGQKPRESLANSALAERLGLFHRFTES